MKKYFKSALATVLTVVMILTAAPLNGFLGLNFNWLNISPKASALTSSGSCGENVKWVYDENSGELSIYGNGMMYDYSSTNRSPWTYVFPWDFQPTSLFISEGITHIGDWAFYECKKIEKVSFPNSLKTIGVSAFDGCISIQSVSFPKSLNLINNYAFQNCQGLKAIELPDSVEKIGNCAFINCGIEYLKLGKNITNIYGGAFNDCKLLKMVDFNCINAICTYSVFTGCKNLSVINIDDNVSTIGNNIFRNCTMIREIEIPNGVDIIGDNSFANCTALEKINIPESIKSIGKGAFNNCTKLKSIIIPESVESIHSDAFDNCDSVTYFEYNAVSSNCEYSYRSCFYFPELKEVYVGKNVSYLPKDFLSNSGNIESIVVSSENKFFDCREESNAIIDSKNNELVCACKKTKIPNSVITIGEYAFNRLDSESVVLPNGVKCIKEYAFNHCSYLSYICIPKSVISIDYYAFFGCDQLTDIYYESTKDDWDKIFKYEECFRNLKIHYNSLGPNTTEEVMFFNICAFSSQPQLKFDINSKLDMTFEIECIDGETSAFIASNTSFSFTSSDNNVFKVKNVKNNGSNTTIELESVNPGTAMLTVSGYVNGALKAGGVFPITVLGETVYHTNTIPLNDDFNIIANGMFICDFKCKNTDSSSCNISFSVYNQKNCFGSVEVYDKDGCLITSQSIENFKGYLPTGLWDLGKKAYNVTKLKDNTFKSEMFSKETKIELYSVPRDGHIVVSNDVNSSEICALYNISYLFTEVTCDVISSVVPENIRNSATTNIVNSIGEAVEENVLKSSNKMLIGMFKSVIKDFVTGFNYGYGDKEFNDIVKLYTLFLKESGVDIGEIVWNAIKDEVKDSAKGVVEDLIYEAFESAGVLMKTGFKLIKYAQVADMMQTVSNEMNSGNTSIYCSKPSNACLYSNGYFVREKELFDENTSFHQYKIVNGKSYDRITETFSDERYIDVFGMSLYNNGIEVQPKGSVEVAIPLPEGLNMFHMKVYREEGDGTYTELKFTVIDGYIYFTTEHFSTYCIVGDKIGIESLTFDEHDYSMNIGDSMINYPYVYPENAYKDDLVWYSTDESVAEVNQSGFVFAIAPGYSEIAVLDADGNVLDYYCVWVNGTDLSIDLQNEVTINYKSGIELSPEISLDYSSDYSIEYKSSNSKIASVDDNGNVYGGKRGSATITCTVTDEYGNSVSDTCTVNVKYAWWQWIIEIVLFGWLWY